MPLQNSIMSCKPRKIKYKPSRHARAMVISCSSSNLQKCVPHSSLQFSATPTPNTWSKVFPNWVAASEALYSFLHSPWKSYKARPRPFNRSTWKHTEQGPVAGDCIINKDALLSIFFQGHFCFLISTVILFAWGDGSVNLEQM